MKPTCEDIMNFKRENITIASENGESIVPALTHELCKGLAVTMSNFGFFTVTHIPTGKSMCGNYERYGSAIGVMAKYQLIAKEWGFCWENFTQEKMKPLLDLEVPFNGETITVRQWIGFLRNSFIADEFPFEGRHPLDSAEDDLRRVAL